LPFRDRYFGIEDNISPMTVHATPTDVSTGQAKPQVDVVRVAARAFEIDRYLSALLAPAAARDDLIALAAFAGEITRIPLFVTEPMMGRIRLQWWREAIENGADGGNPIASALIAAAHRHKFEVSELIRFIDAYETTLDEAPFTDDQALRGHFAATEGVLLSCAVKVLGPASELAAKSDPEDYIAANNAYGLARLLAELPVTLAAGQVLIPRDRLSANHLSPATVMAAAAGNTPQWRALLRDLTSEARQHHQGSVATLAALPRTHRAALFHLALVEPYLQASERGAAMPVTPPVLVQVQPLTRVWRLLVARCTGHLSVTSV
jgi:15-cis-phytoene synthase